MVLTAEQGGIVCEISVGKGRGTTLSSHGCWLIALSMGWRREGRGGEGRVFSSAILASVDQMTPPAAWPVRQMAGREIDDIWRVWRGRGWTRQDDWGNGQASVMIIPPPQLL